ncbi:MAG: hypothetical protein ABJC89_03210 [Acidobacteriota bacterium]
MVHRITRGAVLTLLFAFAADAAWAQAYSAPKARRKFISVSYDWQFTQPLHFLEHPVQDLVGRPVAASQFESYDYRTRDGEILIDVLEFSRRGHGAGVTLYPFGVSVGPALALRASFEDLPTIRIAFTGNGAPPNYALDGARAYDLGAALVVADHSRGFGIGSHAFVGGGVGRIKSDVRDGDRLFGEMGGGLNSGPVGVELSVKFAWNRLTDPVDHQFLTVPITVRGTLTF